MDEFLEMYAIVIVLSFIAALTPYPLSLWERG